MACNRKHLGTADTKQLRFRYLCKELKKDSTSLHAHCIIQRECVSPENLEQQDKDKLFNVSGEVVQLEVPRPSGQGLPPNVTMAIPARYLHETPVNKNDPMYE